MMWGTITCAHLPQEDARAKFFGGDDEIVDVVTGRRIRDDDVELKHGSVLA